MSAGIELSLPERMLFALLRSSLSGEAADAGMFTGLSRSDWEECQRLASRQGVLALAYDGVKTLPSGAEPPKAVKISWAMAVERCESRYHRHCRAIAELSAMLAERGIGTVQIKGLSLSDYYRNPSHRQSSDIDIFTFSLDREKMSDEEANRRANEAVKGMGVTMKHEDYKHNMFSLYGVTIENHKDFIATYAYKIGDETDRLLRKIISPRKYRLENGKDILIPSDEFNTVFLAFHAVQHYGRGFSVHHLCDWASLINKYGLHIPEEVTDKRFRQAILGLTQITNRYLGTSAEVEGGEEMAEVLLRALQIPLCKMPKDPSRLTRLVYKIRWLILRYKLNNTVIDSTPVRDTVRSIVYHIADPKMLFKINLRKS